MIGNPWKTFSAFSAKGVHIPGDKSVPETKWWNHLWLLWSGWKTVAVLRSTADPAIGWKIGFRDFRGNQQIRDEFIHDECVRVKLGREDCTFFALSASGEEIPLEHIGTQLKTKQSSARLL